MNSKEKEYSQALQSNLWKIDVIYAAYGGLFFIPVIIPFFEENGLNLQEIFLLQSILAVITMILEIPSGYFSDRIGRVVTITIGLLALIGGIATHGISTHFGGFLTAILFFSIAQSFFSGTLDALTYDTLLELNQEKRSQKMVGHQHFVRFSSEGVTAIFAGFIALISIRMTVWASLPLAIVAFLMALTLTEPKTQKIQSHTHMKEMVAALKRSLITHVPLRSVMSISIVLSTMLLVLFWCTQPYQTDVGLPLSLFGVTHAVIVLAGAFASRESHRLTEYFDNRTILSAMTILVLLSLLMISLFSSLWMLGFFLLARICWGTTPIIINIINRLTPSKIRATTLSVRTFVFRALFALVIPFIGYMADAYTLQNAIFAMTIAGGIILALIFVFMSNIWDEIPQ